MAPDVTADFLRLYANPPRLHGLRVLFVPGIFTNWYPRYFAKVGEQVPGFEQVKIDTEAVRADNARKIRDAVLAKPEQVLLVGHSKGPLDAHAALVLHPEIVPRVRALVSMQACFHGTPLADDPPTMARLVRSLAPCAYQEMGHAERRAFLQKHPEMPVPAVALATTVSKAGWPLEKTRKFILQKTGQPSDGFVAERDAELPGARMVRLRGLDHAAIALPWMRLWRRKPPYDPVRVTLALLALAAG